MRRTKKNTSNNNNNNNNNYNDKFNDNNQENDQEHEHDHDHDSAKFAIIFQLFTRITTFLMNNFIARSTSASHLGLITMKLDLVNNSILALSRDGIRMALLRADKDDLGGAWMCVPLAFAIGVIVCLASLYSVNEPEILSIQPQFKQALSIYFLATLIECLTEGPVLWCVINKKFRERIAMESVALTIKVSFILVNIIKFKSSLLSTNGNGNYINLSFLLKTFSQAQLIYAIVLNLLYWSMLSPLASSLTSSYSSSCNFDFRQFFKFPPSLKFLSLASALTKQNFFKFFLAQGDLIIIGKVSSLEDQGVYGIVSNYGSLVLRLIMQPIEETSLQFFSRELSGFPFNDNVNDDNDTDNTGDTDNNINNTYDDDKLKFKPIISYFSLMLKTMVYLSLIFICFGTFFTHPLLSILLGKKWTEETEASAALSVYCWLVGAAGISGFLESFTHAIINEKWMNWQRGISLISSIIYCTLGALLILWKGSVGLITASTINFTVRAAVNSFLIQKYFNSHKIKNVWRHSSIPEPILISFAGIFLANFALYFYISADWFKRILIGVALFILIISLIIKNDSIFVKKFIYHWCKR